MKTKAVGMLTIVDLTDIVTGAVAPNPPAIDQLWVDTSGTRSYLRKWDGSLWVIVNDYTDDINTAIDDKLLTVTEKWNTDRDTFETYLLDKVSQTYTTKTDTSALSSTIASIQEQTNTAITDTFKTSKELTETVDGKLTSYIKDTATYIRNSAEGVEVGKTDSPFIMKLSNQELAFLQDGIKVAYMNDQKLYITNAEINDVLTLGDPVNGYFDWTPRSNGNLSLKWRDK